MAPLADIVAPPGGRTVAGAGAAAIAVPMDASARTMIFLDMVGGLLVPIPERGTERARAMEP
jgi:hypothetical protein